jgi:hypothetical protein
MEGDNSRAHCAFAGFLGNALDHRLVSAVDAVEDTNR